jgi:hypothetical protein
MYKENRQMRTRIISSAIGDIHKEFSREEMDLLLSFAKGTVLPKNTSKILSAKIAQNMYQPIPVLHASIEFISIDLEGNSKIYQQSFNKTIDNWREILRDLKLNDIL